MATRPDDGVLSRKGSTSSGGSSAMEALQRVRLPNLDSFISRLQLPRLSLTRSEDLHAELRNELSPLMYVHCSVWSRVVWCVGGEAVFVWKSRGAHGGMQCNGRAADDVPRLSMGTLDHAPHHQSQQQHSSSSSLGGTMGAVHGFYVKKVPDALSLHGGRSGGRTVTRYEVYASTSAELPVFVAEEDSPTLAQTCLGSSRPFVVDIFSAASQARTLRIVRPYACWLSEAQVFDGSNCLLATLQQERGMCARYVRVRNAAGQTLYQMESPWYV